MPSAWVRWWPRALTREYSAQRRTGWVRVVVSRAEGLPVPLLAGEGAGQAVARHRGGPAVVGLVEQGQRGAVVCRRGAVRAEVRPEQAERVDGPRMPIRRARLRSESPRASRYFSSMAA